VHHKLKSAPHYGQVKRIDDRCNNPTGGAVVRCNATVWQRHLPDLNVRGRWLTRCNPISCDALPAGDPNAFSVSGSKRREFITQLGSVAARIRAESAVATACLSGVMTAAAENDPQWRIRIAFCAEKSRS
jgi:hypothetical protein